MPYGNLVWDFFAIPIICSDFEFFEDWPEMRWIGWKPKLKSLRSFTWTTTSNLTIFWLFILARNLRSLFHITRSTSVAFKLTKIRTMSTRETMYSQNPNPKIHSSVQEIDGAPPFGSRFLTVRVKSTDCMRVLFTDHILVWFCDVEVRMMRMYGVKMPGNYLNFYSYQHSLLPRGIIWKQSTNATYWYRDHVPPPEGHDEIIDKALARQRAAPILEVEKGIQFCFNPSPLYIFLLKRLIFTCDSSSRKVQ